MPHIVAVLNTLQTFIEKQPDGDMSGGQAEIHHRCHRDAPWQEAATECA